MSKHLRQNLLGFFTMFYNTDALKTAHEHQKQTIEQSDMCGCFYCLKQFHSYYIAEWTIDNKAICPKCGIDSVVGNNPTKDFLKAMQDYWFNNDGS